MRLVGDHIRMIDSKRPSIPFAEGALSVNGVEFTLYPERRSHTDEDVAYAKRVLRNTRDCVAINIAWIKEIES